MGGAGAAATVADAGVAAVDAADWIAAGENLKLVLDAHDAHRGFLIFFLVHNLFLFLSKEFRRGGVVPPLLLGIILSTDFQDFMDCPLSP